MFMMGRAAGKDEDPEQDKDPVERQVLALTHETDQSEGMV
jgi:hypothetical protein